MLSRLKFLSASKRPDITASEQDVDVAATLEATYEHARTQLLSVTRALAMITAHKTTIEQQSYRLRAQASECDALARTAIKAGDDATAQTQLDAKHAAEANRQVVFRQIAALSTQQNQLAEQSAALKRQVEQFAITKETIKARYVAAVAAAAADESYIAVIEELRGLDDRASDLHERSAQMEARAQALIELQQAGVYEELGS